jgi:hypothetical protein
MRIHHGLILAIIGLVVPATAQIDGIALSADLHTKYGPALKRETFVIPAGEMTVDYGQNGGVCKNQPSSCRTG